MRWKEASVVPFSRNSQSRLNGCPTQTASQNWVSRYRRERLTRPPYEFFLFFPLTTAG